MVDRERAGVARQPGSERAEANGQASERAENERAVDDYAWQANGIEATSDEENGAGRFLYTLHKFLIYFSHTFRALFMVLSTVYQKCTKSVPKVYQKCAKSVLSTMRT